MTHQMKAAAAGVLLATLAVPASAETSQWLREGSQIINVTYSGEALYCTRASDGFEMCHGMSKTGNGTYGWPNMKHPDMPGFMTFKGTVVFDEVTVNGRTGGMVLQVNGTLADVTEEWTGRWVIQRASGDLAGLHGSGPWWGPGAGGPGLPGDLDYGGKIHFHP